MRRLKNMPLRRTADLERQVFGHGDGPVRGDAAVGELVANDAANDESEPDSDGSDGNGGLERRGQGVEMV